MRGNNNQVLTLWRNSEQVQIPLGNSEQKAQRGRNIAIFTRSNLLGWAMYAKGSREHTQMINEIKSYVAQGFRPSEQDVQAKQILMDLRIAY